MAKWGLLVSVVLIVLALFLGSSISFLTYAGDIYWQTDKAGIFAGVIHGILAPLMLVATIFTDYTMYELNNTGWFYNLGFLIGILLVWGGGKNYHYITQHYYKKELSKEDHEKIGKAIEEKVGTALKLHRKEEVLKEKQNKLKELKQKIFPEQPVKVVKKKKAVKK